MVQLTDDLLRLLDREAARTGVSRSEVIRTAVAAYLSESREAELSRRIVEGYRRVPPHTPDEWGDLDAMSEVGTRETLQRLDEEERAAGLEPW